MSVTEAVPPTRLGARPPPHRARILATAGLVLALTVATWPVDSLAPSLGLDPSWQAALHLAAAHRMRFGSELLFNYGPLGFLSAPKLYTARTAALALAYLAGVQAALCATLLSLLRRALGPVAAVLLTFAVARVVFPEPHEVLGALVAVWCLALLQRRPAQADRLAGAAGAVQGGLARWLPPSLGDVRWLPEALGVIGALLLLGKFNVGLAVLLLAAITVVGSADRPWAGLARLLASTVAAALLFWVATGNVLADVASFLGGSMALTTGFTRAMSTHNPQIAWTNGFAPLPPLLVLPLAAAVQDRRRRAAAVAVAALALFFQYKHGFVRHDGGHTYQYLFALTLLPLAFARRGRVGLLVVGWVVLCAALLWWRSPLNVGDLANPLDGAVRAVGQARLVAWPPARQAFVAERRAAQQAALGLDPAVVAALRGQAVHVEPWQAEVVWAYDLLWRPVPVFQTYAAYTPHLDGRNARALAGAHAPRRILRPVPPAAIDGRSPTFESPDYQLALLCNYRSELSTGRWQVLARLDAPRCGPERLLSQQEVRGEQSVAIPAPEGPDRAVLARFELRFPRTTVLRELVYRAERTRIVFDGADARTLVVGTAAGPHLLRLPDGEAAVPLLTPDRTAATFALRVVDAARITFSEIPLTSP